MSVPSRLRTPRCLGVLVAVALVAAGCGGGAAAQGGHPVTIAPEALAERRKAAEQALAAGGRLVDVRSPAEFAQGHLDGAINVPVDAITARSGEAAAALGEKGAPIVVYCGSGRRAHEAAAALAGEGYAGVVELGPMSNGQGLVVRR